MKRIRYFKQDDGSFESKFIEANRDLVQVKYTGLSWKILNSDGIPLAKGSGKTSSQMKKLIKKALKEQGVNFFDEVRNQKIL